MLKGKRVFVTGGAKGIGKAIVEAFCDAGAFVAFCDTDSEAASSLCKRYVDNTQFYNLDVSEAQALSKVMNQVINSLGDLDIIVNNVGISVPMRLEEQTVDNFDRILSTNLRPVFITSQTLASHRHKMMVLKGEQQSGRIVNIASTRYLQSEPGWEAYAASKGGIVSLTHALAVSFAPYNITVNCISPGWIETGDYENLKLSDHRQHPSGRVGKPEDIARLCLFLCDPKNDFITGENIIVDGGMTKKMIYEE